MNENEPTFAAPWEARVFATMVHLQAQRRIAWPDFAAALARAVANDEARPYYESWLVAAEEVMRSAGLLRAGEVDAALHALAHAQQAQRVQH